MFISLPPKQRDDKITFSFVLRNSVVKGARVLSWSNRPHSLLDTWIKSLHSPRDSATRTQTPLDLRHRTVLWAHALLGRSLSSLSRHLKRESHVGISSQYHIEGRDIMLARAFLV